jgi:hypothetical protein
VGTGCDSSESFRPVQWLFLSNSHRHPQGSFADLGGAGLPGEATCRARDCWVGSGGKQREEFEGQRDLTTSSQKLREIEGPTTFGADLGWAERGARSFRYYLRANGIFQIAREAATKPKTMIEPGSGTGAGCGLPPEPALSITWAASSTFEVPARSLGATFLGELIFRSLSSSFKVC